jgi:putative SOS response-associated peptidase YedK
VVERVRNVPCLAVCGRFVTATPADELAAYFGAALSASISGAAEGVAADSRPPANHNVAPTADIGAVVDTPDGRELAMFHWGLVPSWAKDRKIGSKMINARAETLLEKGVFKGLFARNRCIIPADGFYEWKAITVEGQAKPVKQPYFIHSVSGEPLAFAGLWTSWRDPAAEGPGKLYSATIITTAANDTMTPVHDRMPVLLPASRWAEWLDLQNRNVDDLASLLAPAPNDLLTMYPVSTDVNSVRNNGPHLLTPL